MTEPTVDALVIGAGFAGLKAARTLMAAGKTVRVLEARDRVGGRSKPGTLCGETIDLGGQWVGPQQTRLLQEAAALGVKTKRQYTAGLNVLSIDGKRQTFTGETPRLPLHALLELALLERRWARETATLPAHGAWHAPRAAEWDAHSVESWLQRHVRTHGAREFVRIICRAVLCTEASQASYLCFLDYLRQGQGLQSLIGVEGGAQQDKFVGGAWQIAQRLAEPLVPHLTLQAPVLALEQHDDSVTATTPQGRFTARRAIVAVPPLLAAGIDYAQPLPTPRLGLLQRSPMGAVIKIHVAYAEPFWRQQGYSGMAISNRHAFNVVFDQTPEDGRIGLLVGFMDGAGAVQFSARSAAERQAQVVADLMDYFGPAAAQPMGYIDQDWTQERYSLGGYVAHTAPGVLTTYAQSLREPCGRLHWAGTETATAWAGYLDGALQSGERAAGEVVAAG